jgi:hypothetical protein
MDMGLHEKAHQANLALRALKLAIEHERPFNEVVELARKLVERADELEAHPHTR